MVTVVWDVELSKTEWTRRSTVYEGCQKCDSIIKLISNKDYFLLILIRALFSENRRENNQGRKWFH